MVNCCSRWSFTLVVSLGGVALLGCGRPAEAPPASTAPAPSGLSAKNDGLIRDWYKGWTVRDWHGLDVLLTDDFTFSSAAGDDHISKSDFKKNCWETQIDHMGGMDIQQLHGSGDDALVMYVGTTKNGKTFKNVEHLQLRDGKIASIECYFGSEANFPSAVSKTVSAPK